MIWRHYYKKSGRFNCKSQKSGGVNSYYSRSNTYSPGPNSAYYYVSVTPMNSQAVRWSHERSTSGCNYSRAMNVFRGWRW